MPAPDLATLLDIETQVEDAIVATLIAAQLPAVRTDNVEMLNTPRVEVRAKVTQHGPHEIAVPSGSIAGRRVYDQFRVEASIDLVATPTNGQPMGSLRGRTRAAIYAIDPATIGARLTYLALAVNSWRMAVGDRQAEDEEGAIRVSGTVAAEVFILPTAWPA